MKIKLTQPGWETYSGQMGVLFFENGTSTAEVSPRDAARMAATMQCHFEDGTSCNPAQRLLDLAHMEANGEMTTTPDDTPPAPLVDVEAPVEIVNKAQPKREDANVLIVGSDDGVVTIEEDQAADEAAPVAPKVEGEPYTVEELGAIADAKGISGLREVAEKHGVKSNSIKGLIDAILAAGIKKEA